MRDRLLMQHLYDQKVGNRMKVLLRQVAFQGLKFKLRYGYHL